MRLFAERGYAQTSIADVQSACGLAAGSGALYEHFTSKAALLGAGVHRYVEDLRAHRAGFVGWLPDDPAAALAIVAAAVAGAMAEDRSIIRITFRDLEGFPDLLEALWQGLLGALYRELADWITGQVEQGRAEVVDPPSTAAVLVASLTYPQVLDALVGHRPGDVAPQAYLAAWVDSAVATLRPTPGGTR